MSRALGVSRVRVPRLHRLIHARRRSPPTDPSGPNPPTCPPCADDKSVKMSIGSEGGVGRRSHPRAERPRRRNPLNSGASRWTRLRFVDDSATRSRTATVAGCGQPAILARTGARRRFTSSEPRSFCASAISVLTSTINRVRVAGWKARRSTRTPIAVMVEADLFLHKPSPPIETAMERRGHGRVILVHQPVRFASAPPRSELQPNCDHGQAGTQGSERQAVQIAKLESRPGGPMHLGRSRAIQLPPPALAAHGAHQSAQFQVAHR